jgi:protein-disulfide isomerase
MRTRSSYLVIAVYAIGCSYVDAGQPNRPDVPVRAKSPVVATVGDKVITADELDEWLGNALFPIRTQEYEVKTRKLRERITRMLLEEEAARRKMSVAELERDEIDNKVRPVTEEEARAVQEAAGSGVLRGSEDVLSTFMSRIKEQRIAQRRAEFLKGLQSSAIVRLQLDPPRLAVSEDGAARGPATAPVTIVEFGDFQCPVCARTPGLIKDVEKKYGDRVRVVFRHLPLPMHKEAPKAAEAAICADEQGRFWEMHDKLYANAKDLTPPALRRYAGELSLDAQEFDKCLESGRGATRWQKDKADADKYGVRGTPAFFINGRMVAGLPRPEALAEVVDDELLRAGGRPRSGEETKATQRLVGAD